jgi:hypothetical protein
LGLRKAIGKWILFADSDDLFMDNFLTILYKYFETSYEIVYFPPTSVYKFTRNISKRHIPYARLVTDYIEKNEDIFELKLRYGYVSPCSKLFSKEFLEAYQIKFDEVIASNDVMFSVRTGYYMKKFFVARECIYCITDRDGSLTKNKNEDVYYARLNTHIRMSNFLRSHISEREYKILRIGGRGFLKVAAQNRLGIKVLVKTLFLLIKNQIPLMYFEDFNFIRNRKEGNN